MLNDEFKLADQLKEFDEWLAFFSEPPERERACVRGKNRVVTRVRLDDPIAACVQKATDENIDIIRLPWGGVEVVRQYSEAKRFSEEKDRFLVPGSVSTYTFDSMMAYLETQAAKHPIRVLQERRSYVRSLFGELTSPDHELLFPRRQ